MDTLATWGAELGSGANEFGGSDLWDTAANIGTAKTQEVYRLPDTVAADAITSSQPMTTSAPSEWGGFFRDTFKAVIGYGIARDAIKNGVQANAGYPVGQYAATAPRQVAQPLISGNTLFLLVVGGVVLFAVTRK